MIAFSDSHGHGDILRRIVLRHRHESEIFLFLGDGESDLEPIRREFAETMFVFVRGNNDIGSQAPLTELRFWNGVGFFMTHGFQYTLARREFLLTETARKNGASVALFGHTHYPVSRYENGIWLINPGSVVRPRDGSARSYAMIDLIARDDGSTSVVPIITEVGDGV